MSISNKTKWIKAHQKVENIRLRLYQLQEEYQFALIALGIKVEKYRRSNRQAKT